VTDPECIGVRIARLRRLHLMKQTELGRRIGVSGNVISQWESERNTPRSVDVPKLAAVLGVSCHYLLTGTEWEPLATLEIA
jgi:transcriptional regulator with XRE-family HTH domain